MTGETGVLRVERVDPSEWERLRDVRLAALADTPEAFGSTLAREAAFDEGEWRGRVARAFLASRDGVDAGIAAVVVIDGEWWVTSMWVAPAARGTGVVAALLNAGERAARDAGAERVLLGVVRDNDRARRAYERLGFEDTGRRDRLPDGREETVLRKTLSAGGVVAGGTADAADAVHAAEAAGAAGRMAAADAADAADAVGTADVASLESRRARRRRLHTESGGAAADATTAAEGPSEPDARRRGQLPLGVVMVGIAAVAWWPAFTLGAWHEIFFDDILALWAASTAAFVFVLIERRPVGARLARATVLLIPTVWLVLSFTFNEATDIVGVLVVLAAIVAVFVALPFTLWTLVRIVWPDISATGSRRERWTVVGVVGLVVVSSFLLGLNQASFLTCEDFTISGNSEPPGCTPAPEMTS